MKYLNVIICGFGRSGSTLLYNMLRTSIKNYIFHAREVSISTISSKQVHESNTCSKYPADVYDIDKIMKLYSSVGFILCIRDVRSIICSRMKKKAPFKMGADYTYRSRNQKVIQDKRGVLSVHEACVNALKYNPFICKYEELVTSPNMVQQKMKQYFEWKSKGRFFNFYKHSISSQLRSQMHTIRPVDTEGINAWKKEPERIIEQFTNHPQLFDVLEFWGYEKDRDWFKELTQ